MILAHEKYPACSEDKCQDTACSDESKLEKDVVDKLCEEDGVDHGASYTGRYVDKRRYIKLETQFEERREIEIEMEMKKGERLWVATESN
jgi:hypothetical protein